MRRDIFNLMSHDGWQTCFVLNLEPYSEADAFRSINWQIRGGATRDQIKTCRWDDARRAFVETGNGMAHKPERGPYTEKAWTGFLVGLEGGK